MPRSVARIRIATTESSAKARPAAIPTWASEATSSTPRASMRSTTRPASGASTTTGAHRATKSAATAKPESVISCRCSVSGIQSRKSPSAEMPTAPTISRTSDSRSKT
jgi:hypothetical protein